MARKITDGAGDGRVVDYRYDRAKRKNNPPAGLAAQGRIAERPVERYSYNPHLPPVLRFDSTGRQPPQSRRQSHRSTRQRGRLR